MREVKATGFEAMLASQLLQRAGQADPEATLWTAPWLGRKRGIGSRPPILATCSIPRETPQALHRGCPYIAGRLYTPLPLPTCVQP